MKFKTCMVALAVAVTLLAGAAACPAAAGQSAGGYANAGMDGQYFDNAELKGEPKFIRRDVRIRFDWGETLPVGGSTAEPYKGLSHDNFSVRWTGAVIPRVSEAYIFKADAVGGVRVKLKTPDATDLVTIIDAWDKGGIVTSSPVTVNAGQKYELVVEYRHATGPAKCGLSWSCPSFPEEVIEPVAGNGWNLRSWYDQVWANRAQVAGWSVKEDDNGWPTADARLVPWNTLDGVKGTWLLQFKGKAEVVTALCPIVFHAGGKDYKVTLPRGTGYDGATNSTSVTFTVDQGNIVFFDFKKTTRDGSDDKTDTGVTDVKVMRPIYPGSDRSHRADELFYRPLKDACRDHVSLRWDQVGDKYAQGTWANRTRPTFARFTHEGFWSGAKEAPASGECWELLIMLANEMGKDLHLSLPMQCDDEYFTKLAQVCKYGSDGDQPYAAVQANPKFPPLNPNLCVYLEVGNEIWNWGFQSTQWLFHDALKDIEKADSEEWKIVNFDGRGRNNYRRLHALRTVHASNAFRQVFGDAGMGPRVRVLLEYQGDNANGTATSSYVFLDGYFNNRDGEHVKEPRPAKYYIWGSGGATYYGTGNSYGVQKEIIFKDAGLEESTVPAGQATAPAKESPWKFSGNAGIYRKGELALAAEPDKTAKVTPVKGAAAGGCKIRIGEKPLTAYELGRWLPFRRADTTLAILKAADNSVLATVSLAGEWRHGEPAYRFAVLKSPVKLEANTEYYLMSNLGNPAGETAIRTGPGFACVGPAVAAGVAEAAPKDWKTTSEDKPNQSIGLINMRYTIDGTISDVAKPFPLPIGNQAAYLKAKGQISQTIEFPRKGAFALRYNAAGLAKGYPPVLGFEIHVGEQVAKASIGGWARDSRNIHEVWGSNVFVIDKPGPVEICIVALPNADPEAFTVFDNIEISSVDAILDSGFGSGQALGVAATADYAKALNILAGLPRSLGIHGVAYEGGWSLGGDFQRQPIQEYAKFYDDRARTINVTAMDLFTQAGGDLIEWGVYTYWPASDMTHPDKYPIQKSIIELNNRLPAEAANGTAVPAKLTPANVIAWRFDQFNGKFSGLLEQKVERGAEWASWLIICPSTGNYGFKADCTPGGMMEFEVDGDCLGRFASDAAKPVSAKLTKGLHGLRVRNVGGSFTIKSVAVEQGK